MKSRKPKAKGKAKRNPKQQTGPAPQLSHAVPAPEIREIPPRVVETPGELETSATFEEAQLSTPVPSAVAEIAVPAEPPAIPASAGLQETIADGPVVPAVETRETVEAAGAPAETQETASVLETPGELERQPDQPVDTPTGADEDADSPASFAELREIIEDSASTVELREQPEQVSGVELDGALEIDVEVEEVPSSAQLPAASAAAPVTPASAASNYDGSEIPAIPVDSPPAAQPPAPARSAPPSAADRRAHPRYAFVASIEVVAPELGERVKTQVRDLSQQGCYVDTNNPLALGTSTEVRIVKGATTFEALARVVYNQTAKGMGLMFTTVELEHLKTLDTWIAESRESSWRAANRRRSQRVMMRVPVRVSGQSADGAKFEAETHTLSISPHGALLVLVPTVQRGQRFILANLQTKSALECVVAHLERIPGEPTQVGVEFSLPNPAFWRVAFPPKDWTPRHPDAKSR